MKEEPIKSIRKRLNDALINSSEEKELDELFTDLVQERVDERIDYLSQRIILFVMLLLFFSACIFFHYLPKEQRPKLHYHIDNIYKPLER